MTSPNWKNRTMWTGDNLNIMRGMNSESVDLIYLDPPFNSKANYAAPIGSEAAGAAFKDTWTLDDVDVEWINLIEAKYPALHRVLLVAMTDSDKSYLAYMAIRLLEMKRILKPTGSIYLHCDPTMSHYLKIVMDAVFGRRNFRNEIVWCYTGASNTPRWFPRKHDIVLSYCNGEDAVFYRDKVRIPYHPETLARKGRADDSWFTNPKRSQADVRDVLGNGKVPEDWWEDIPKLTNQRERVGYPTQKPLALLNRIIQANCPDGGIVFDPFCGCATTLVAAEDIKRAWIGIDIPPKAADLVVERIEERQGLWRDITHRTDIPQRTDLGDIPAYNCAENINRLYGVQGGECAGCREHFRKQNMEVDHIIAISKGGNGHIDNLQLLCSHCNRVKGNRGMDYLMAKLQLLAA